jgi:predicted TPR repeat methyltransferase
VELTIEQTLHQAVTAHKEGRLQDAERLYCAVLQTQPLNEVANHNLGALAVLGNQAHAALPLFKTALETNSRVERFWLSYIDALIKDQQFEAAKQVLVQAQKQGIDDDKLNFLKAQLLKAQLEPISNKGNPSRVRPTQKQLSCLLMDYQSERYDDAEKLARAMSLQYPRDNFSLHILAAVLMQTGRASDVVSPRRKAVEFIPEDAKAQFNLGKSLYNLGRLEEAAESYKQGVSLEPDFTAAHYELGIMFKKLGSFEEAGASFTQAISLEPDFTAAHYELGIMLKKLGSFDEAGANFTQAISLEPDFTAAYYELGHVLWVLGRLDEARAIYRQVIALKPDLSYAKHMLAALSGETTETAPRDYVERLFDNYAADFENSLLEKLEYKIPAIIAQIILKNNNYSSLGSVFDLGCGTGLFGAEIKSCCDHLVGIDLSEKMLKKAEEKNIYDKLVKEDIVDYLSNEGLNFDYFISTDVFNYVGDLSDIFRLIKVRNKKSGKLAFSTENYDGDGFFLEQTGRYSHSKMYIESLCKTFGYELLNFEIHPLRKDGNQYISGGLYLLEF